MAQFSYKGINLVQKHTGKPTCEGCFFTSTDRNKETKQYPCCERVNYKFTFPCSKDIIYVKEDNKQ